MSGPIIKKILEQLAKKAKPKPKGKPKGKVKKDSIKVENVKSSGFNTKKKTYIVSPHAPVMTIEEYGKKYLKNPPGKIIRVLNSTGGLIKGKPKLAKRGWK